VITVQWTEMKNFWLLKTITGADILYVELEAPLRISKHSMSNCKWKETQLSLTNCATHLCKCNGVADLLKYSPRNRHICYHAEFGRSALKCVGINTEEPQKLESDGFPPLGVWRYWPIKTSPSPFVLPREIW